MRHFPCCAVQVHPHWPASMLLQFLSDPLRYFPALSSPSNFCPASKALWTLSFPKSSPAAASFRPGSLSSACSFWGFLGFCAQPRFSAERSKSLYNPALRIVFNFDERSTNFSRWDILHAFLPKVAGGTSPTAISKALEDEQYQWCSVPKCGTNSFHRRPNNDKPRDRTN